MHKGENAAMSCEVKVSKPERSSGVELFRIIAMVLICLSHAAQTALGKITLGNSFADFLVSVFYNSFGELGNIIFIVCSCFFLTDSKGVKSNKVIKILLDSTCISVIIYVVFWLCGYSFTPSSSIRHFLPDLFSNMWFIPVYVLFYMVHPLINAAVRGISRKTHFVFVLLTFCIYGFGGLVFNWALGINRLVETVAIYVVIAYIKIYRKDLCQNKRVNAIAAGVSALLFWALSAAKFYLKLDSVNLVYYYSPVAFTLVFSVFNLLNGAKFRSKTVNFLASCSLFFYCIHENYLIRKVLRPAYYDHVLAINPGAYFGWVMLCFALWLVGGYLLAVFYKLTFSQLTAAISSKLGALFDRFVNFLMSKTKQVAEVEQGVVANEAADKTEPQPTCIEPTEHVEPQQNCAGAAGDGHFEQAE